MAAALLFFSRQARRLGGTHCYGDAVAGKARARLTFGATKMNSNYFMLVDEVQEEGGEQSHTIVVKEGDDFIRLWQRMLRRMTVSLDRAIGTSGRASSDRRASESRLLRRVRKSISERLISWGKPYVTGYEPIAMPSTTTSSHSIIRNF